MIWEPCLDVTCCPPLTSGGGMTVPELLPVKIWLEKNTIRKQYELQCEGALICCLDACVIVEH